MQNVKIYCNLCRDYLCEGKQFKKTLVVCPGCKCTVKLNSLDDGSIQSSVYPYELAMKKRPDLYVLGRQ